MLKGTGTQWMPHTCVAVFASMPEANGLLVSCTR